MFTPCSFVNSHNHYLHLFCRKDLPGILPSAVIDCMNPQQWLNLIHDELPMLESMSPHEARVESIEIIKKWQLFGSSFFDIIVSITLETQNNQNKQP